MWKIWQVLTPSDGRPLMLNADGEKWFRRALLFALLSSSLSPALSVILYPASREWLTHDVTPPCPNERSLIGGHKEGKCLSRKGLDDRREKYPWYGVRDNSTGWVSQYGEEKKNNPNYNPQSFNDCVCSIWITAWPDDMAVRYLYLVTGRKF